MSILSASTSGSLQSSKSGKRIVIRFQNFSLTLTPRSLKKLYAYLSTQDYAEGLSYPLERRFEVAFASFPMTLYFNYYEITELMELIEEGLAEYNFQCLLKETGVSSSLDAMA